MATMTESRTITGSLQEVWDVVCDMPSFPKFMEDIYRVKIQEGSVESGRTVTQWIAMNEGAPMIWIEEDLFDGETHTIDYHMRSGDLEKLEGTWKLEAIPALADVMPQTRVIMFLVYEFGVPELQDLIGDAMDVKVVKNCKMMLDGIEQRVAECRRVVIDS
ncbi:MAG: SRPBCC family protein [Patescibacteria group bacterium]